MVILSLFNYNLIQVMSVLALNFIYACLLFAFKPYASEAEQRNEALNEILTLTTIYFMLLFLPDLINGEMRE